MTLKHVVVCTSFILVSVLCAANTHASIQTNPEATASQEAQTTKLLRTVATAELRHMGGRHDSIHYPPARLAGLIQEGLLDPSDTDGSVHNGYTLSEVSIDADKGTWEFKAEPIDDAHGHRSFNIIEDYVIRFLDGSRAPRGLEGEVLGAREVRHANDMTRDQNHDAESEPRRQTAVIP